MKFCLVLLAALPFFAGCARHYPDSPLGADSHLASQCAAIRGNVPYNERGTSADPTSRRDSLCYGVQTPAYVQPAGPGIASPLYPVRAVYDAAFDY